MAEQRGSASRGSRGSGSRFYNENVNVAGKDLSIATIILGGLTLFGLFGGTFATGLMSRYGFVLALFAGAVWLAWSVSRDGVFSLMNQIFTFVLALLAIIWIFFSFIPHQLNNVNTNEWEQVFTNFNTNVQTTSPFVNQPITGVTLPNFDNAITTNDPNIGGGSPSYTSQPDVDVHEQPVYTQQPNEANNVPAVSQPATPSPATPSPTAGLERQLENAIMENDGVMVMELTGQILTINPDHANAKVWNSQVISEKIHVDSLRNMPQPTGDFMAGVDSNSLQKAIDLLGSNGEKPNGYQYIVLDNGAKTSSVGCNETAILELQSGLYAGQSFTTQRCLVSSIAGGSENGKVFTVR